MNKQFEEILMNLRKWENCGIRILDNGTKLICHVPHIAPQAWLHKIYAGLEDSKIKELETQLDLKLPEDYAKFLKLANGINVFSDSLSIWGLKTSYSRTRDTAFQPYDIVALNQEKTIPNNWLIFGSYSWDGSVILYDLENNSSKVYRYERNSTKIIQEWDTLLLWFSSEIVRLSKLFDDEGIEYDEETPTIPII